MKNKYTEIEAQSDMAAEPMAVYGIRHRHHTPMTRNSNKERIMANTVSVDEYFDELIRMFHN